MRGVSRYRGDGGRWGHDMTEKVVIHYYLLRRASDTVTAYDKSPIKNLSRGNEAARRKPTV